MCNKITYLLTYLREVLVLNDSCTGLDHTSERQSAQSSMGFPSISKITLSAIAHKKLKTPNYVCDAFDNLYSP